MKFVTMLALAVGILLGGVAHAEDITGKVGRFRLDRGDSTVVEGKKGYYTPGDFFFYHLNGRRDSIAVASIVSLEEFKGSRADTFGGIGAITGFAAGLLTAWGSGYLEAGRGGTGDGRAVRTIAGLTVLGSAFGYICGSTIQRWERIPLSLDLISDSGRGGNYLTLSLGL